MQVKIEDKITELLRERGHEQLRVFQLLLGWLKSQTIIQLGLELSKSDTYMNNWLRYCSSPFGGNVNNTG